MQQGRPSAHTCYGDSQFALTVGGRRVAVRWHILSPPALLSVTGHIARVEVCKATSDVMIRQAAPTSTLCSQESMLHGDNMTIGDVHI
jgi:hypothetical protein